MLPSLSEFMVLVEVLIVEQGSAYPAYTEDILSLYQFSISSANAQPTDKGKSCEMRTVQTHTNTCEAYLRARFIMCMQDQHC